MYPAIVMKTFAHMSFFEESHESFYWRILVNVQTKQMLKLKTGLNEKRSHIQSEMPQRQIH